MYKYEQGCDKILNNPIRFKYKNWKDEISIRTLIPIEVWYGESDFHKGTQWFLKAYDLDKLDKRDFAIKDIIEYIEMEEDSYGK